MFGGHLHEIQTLLNFLSSRVSGYYHLGDVGSEREIVVNRNFGFLNTVVAAPKEHSQGHICKKCQLYRESAQATIHQSIYNGSNDRLS